jgi:hypothetical protein
MLDLAFNSWTQISMTSWLDYLRLAAFRPDQPEGRPTDGLRPLAEVALP